MMFDGVSFSPSVRSRIRNLQTDAHHPEAHLLLAILDRAIHDLDCGGPVTRSAERWFRSRGAAHAEFTFLDVCDYLDIPAGDVQRAILRH
jgi:hypothetical protein